MTNLQDLPSELLQTICEYIAGPLPSNLHPFSQTSKFCLSASSLTLWRSISFTGIGRVKLQSDVDGIRAILDKRDARKSVRYISVRAHMRQKHEDVDGTVSWPRDKSGLQERAELGELARWSPIRSVGSEDPQLAYRNNDAWLPLASLLQELPSLTDIEWEKDQVPPCILQAIHRHHPQCRLRVEGFRLNSLGHKTLDRHEMALATSPSLHLVSFRYESWVTQAVQTEEELHNISLRAMLCMVGGTSPNLSGVRFCFHPRFHLEPGLLQQFESSKHYLPPLHPDESPIPRKTGALSTLQLSKYKPLTRDEIAVWATVTDFSVLRVLKIGNGIETAALDWMAANCSFVSLETLVLSLYHRQCPAVEESVLASFFQVLAPLRNAMLYNEVSPSILKALLSRHASTLRQLRIENDEWIGIYFDFPAFKALEENPLPRLQHIHINIKRSMGDANEVGIYKALGSLPSLQNISLVLECGDHSICAGVHADFDPDDPSHAGYYAMPNDSYDEFHQQIWQVSDTEQMRLMPHPRYGHIRDAMIRSAVDETLAEAIFHTISAAKPYRSLPLERLRLHPRGGCNFGDAFEDGHLQFVFRHIERSWLVERKSPGLGLAGLVTTELEQRRRGGNRPPARLEPQTEKIFRKLWPVRPGTAGDWREDWHSFPLIEMNDVAAQTP